MYVTLGDIIRFLQQRSSRNCPPLRRFVLPFRSDMTLDNLRQITSLLGPNLRTLDLGSLVDVQPHEWETFLNIIDMSHPLLEHLFMNIRFKGALPLPEPSPCFAAFAKLRSFRFNVCSVYSPILILEYIRRLGPRECVYSTTEGSQEDSAALNMVVRTLKL